MITFCSEIVMYDMYECNVGYKNVNYSRKVIVLYSAYDRSNIIAVCRREYECDYSWSRMATP